MEAEKFGEWRIGRFLAKDVRGSIYSVQRNHPESTPAILYHFDSISTFVAGFGDRLKDYVAQAQKLSHPNILPVLDGGISDGRAFLVTEGDWDHNLENAIRLGKRYSWVDVLLMAIHLVSALRYLHRRGIVHRDLRPARIFFNPQTQSVQVSHAGIEELFSSDHLTLTDNPLGPAGFISPEQASGKRITKKSDFYSLGCTLYVLLTARTPFAANNIADLIHKHCHALPERPIHLVPDLPAEIDNLVTRLLNKDPNTRPSSGTLLLEELEKIWTILYSQGKVGIRPPNPENFTAATSDKTTPKLLPSVQKSAFTPPPTPKKPLLHRGGVVLLLFLLVLGLLIYGFFGKRSESAETLYSQALPLMQSADPNDWRKAWQDFLEPLSKRYPNQYQQEIAEFKRRYDSYEDFHMTLLASSRQTSPSSEGERLYRRGVRLLQAGEVNNARQTWERLISAYSGVESEKVWVQLAEYSLQRTTSKGPAKQVSRQGIIQVLERLDALKPHNQAEADKILAVLLDLYRDDPDATEAYELLKSTTILPKK
jgi:serine/threonine-protein kinase